MAKLESNGDDEYAKVALADGTNVRKGTEFIYRSSMSGNVVNLNEHTEAAGWAKRGERVLSEFRSFREKALPVAVVVMQQRFPGHGENGLPSDLRQHGLLMGGGGAHVDIGQLLSPDTGQPITGLFPFLEASGRAIRFSNGEPVGLRLGFSRIYTLHEQSHAPSDDRQLLEGRLKELCEEAGRLILDLPSQALDTIWARWGVHICLPDDDTFCWLDALFEYGWTPRRRSQGLPRYVYDTTGHGSVVLQGNGLFPRVPVLELGEILDSKAFPTEAGHPFRWSSTIDDTTSTSIDLLEWIVAEGWTVMPPSERPSSEAAKDASPEEVSEQLPSGLDVPQLGHIFLSYVRENESLVNRLYQELTAAGLTVWFDRENLDTGMRWKSAIRDGIRKGSFFIACFSREHASRDTSYMNEELTLAIEELRRRPSEKAWFVPVRLSDCEIPDRDIGAGETLRDLHYVDLSSDWSLGVQRLISLFKRAVPDSALDGS